MCQGHSLQLDVLVKPVAIFNWQLIGIPTLFFTCLKIRSKDLVCLLCWLDSSANAPNSKPRCGKPHPGAPRCCQRGHQCPQSTNPLFEVSTYVGSRDVRGPGALGQKRRRLEKSEFRIIQDRRIDGWFWLRKAESLISRGFRVILGPGM